MPAMNFAKPQVEHKHGHAGSSKKQQQKREKSGQKNKMRLIEAKSADQRCFFARIRVKVLRHEDPRARAQTLVVPDTLKSGPLHDGKTEAHFGHDHAGRVCIGPLTPLRCQLLVRAIEDLRKLCLDLLERRRQRDRDQRKGTVSRTWTERDGHTNNTMVT